ncbi:hypothetical protein [Lachnotalea sp. AF33-28]|uniref:hypothetical protein n=1 Tax=Lachnotalea sp. AF33-28 TaxID=2292046 RepID=UPI0011C4AC74|nr:hypothetical protein [Lachnotalea sp. AF33-28]
MMLKDSSGTTLVSVIVSFAVLMIVILIFTQAVNLSLNLSRKTDEILEDTLQAVNLYYTEDVPEKKLPVTVRIGSDAAGGWTMEGNLCQNGESPMGKIIYYFSP